MTTPMTASTTTGRTGTTGASVPRGAAAKEASMIPHQVAAMALTGVLMFVASIPLVTVLAAGGAGAQLLREQAVSDREPRVRRFVRLFCTALRDPIGALMVLVLLVVGALDLLAVLGGAPGARVLGPVLGLLGVAAVVCGLRAAARWHPGLRWADALVAAARATLVDPAGSAVLVVALALVAVIVTQAAAFVVLAPGLLVLAALAVELRPRRR